MKISFRIRISIYIITGGAVGGYLNGIDSVLNGIIIFLVCCNAIEIIFKPRKRELYDKSKR